MPLHWTQLSEAGIAIPRQRLTSDPGEAVHLLRDVSPAALCVKAVTDAHKARLGLVRLGLRTEAAVEAAFHDVRDRARELLGEAAASEVLVQEQIEAGPELIVGAVRDPVFGPVALLGVGGRLAESVARTAVRLLPLDPAAAADQTRELLGEPEPGVARVLLAFAALFDLHPELVEAEINPLVLGGPEPVAVDLRSIDYDSPPEPRASRPAAGAAIRKLLSPRSVAIVGASTNPAKPGGRALRSILQRAPGVSVHPVNPRAAEIDGIPAVPDIESLPSGIDAAIVATDAASVAGALEALAGRGIEAAVVFAGGFREAGNPGAETELAAVALRNHIRFCGVNTIGVIGDAPLTFSLSGEMAALPGSVSFLTQSGAIGGSMQMRAWAQGLGTARYVCVGNQTDLDLADYLDYFVHDPQTRTVGMFVEGVQDGRRFMAALRALREAGKAVAVVRSGASAAGAMAALSHTGVLAGSSRVYAEVFRTTGVAVAGDIPELIAMCTAFDWQPRAAGRRVGVVATSGGACGLIADLATARGLELPPLEEALQERLRGILPGFAPTRNPVETTGQVVAEPELFGRTIEVMLESRQFDVLVLSVSTLYGAIGDRVATDLVRLAAGARVPLTVGWSLPESTAGPAIQRLRAARVPVFDSWSLAVAGAAALAAGR